MISTPTPPPADEFEKFLAAKLEDKDKAIIGQQVASWRKEIARLQGMIAAVSPPSAAASDLHAAIMALPFRNLHAEDSCGLYAQGFMVARQSAAVLARFLASEQFDFHAHLARQAEFSLKTFGQGARTAGVCDHIRKELLEIEADPLDLKEWIDVVILALDGAWRCGGSPAQIIDGIVAKQSKNEGRNWPDWRTADPDKAIEHDRFGEAVAAESAAIAFGFAPQAVSALDDAALVEELRQLAVAYPVEVFTELTQSEREQMGSMIDRASAAMGRHFSTIFTRAADAISAQPLPAAPLPQEPAGSRMEITINGRQLRDALDAAWPDRVDPEQGDTELTLFVRKEATIDGYGDPMPAGLWFCWSDYPEEGVCQLDADAPEPARATLARIAVPSEQSKESVGKIIVDLGVLRVGPEGGEVVLNSSAFEEICARLARTAAPSVPAVFVNRGEQMEDTAHLDCPHCGGSGHRDDADTAASEWLAIPTDLSSAAIDVLAERQRQKDVEGWTTEHDDEHATGAMARAAAVYAVVGSSDGRNITDDGSTHSVIERLWPWDWSWFKANGRRRNLVKSGALVLAEIERIDRAAKGGA